MLTHFPPSTLLSPPPGPRHPLGRLLPGCREYPGCVLQLRKESATNPLLVLSYHLGNKEGGPDDEWDSALEYLPVGGRSGESERRLFFPSWGGVWSVGPPGGCLLKPVLPVQVLAQEECGLMLEAAHLAHV